MDVEILKYVDDLKASMESTETVQTVHEMVNMYAASVGMVINKKKCAIQLNPEMPPTVSPRNPKNG